VYAPYGLGIEWPQDTGFRSLALHSELSYLTINPVVAWRILTNLSIAAGPTFNYSELRIRRGITPFPNNDLSDLQGSGFSFGATAGVLWQPLPQLSLGASYRSEAKVNYEGNTTVNFTVPPPGFPPSLKMDANVEIPTPQNVIAGISYRPTPAWNLEFDVDWTDWSRLKTITVHQLIPDSLVLNWDSSFYYEFGVTRYFSGGWHVSAGYIYNQNSVPDQTFTPLVPDQDRQFVTVGAGYRGKHFELDAAYEFGFSSSRTVQGSPVSAVGQTADGRYEYISHALAISAGWHF
jgi:long-chain fatty acid transport protein